MGGFSGKAVALHTPIVTLGGHHFAISSAQKRIIERAKAQGGTIYVRGAEVRSVRLLVSLGIGTLIDDGAFGPKAGASNTDGERWTFTLAKGVST